METTFSGVGTLKIKGSRSLGIGSSLLLLLFSFVSKLPTEIATASEQAGATLKATEKRLADIALLAKNITAYQQIKPAYGGYRAANNKAQYRAVNESALILHEAPLKP